MKITFGDLWRPSGTIDRGEYALVGALGFALKHNLDRIVATYGFHRPWSLFNYWVPARDVARIGELRRSEAAFLETMVAIALPFVWVGVVLTLEATPQRETAPLVGSPLLRPICELVVLAPAVPVARAGLRRREAARGQAEAFVL